MHSMGAQQDNEWESEIRTKAKSEMQTLKAIYFIRPIAESSDNIILDSVSVRMYVCVCTSVSVDSTLLLNINEGASP